MTMNQDAQCSRQSPLASSILNVWRDGGSYKAKVAARSV
jgi:hypothetical protein